ncbi:serine protease [Nocardia sp. NBC_00565]|uniref:serine protease n=1 Tax=Nocardia sp. NBC_00565 TaxID=2975993 RepID=UPI002E8156EA|nr:serine protease [Nocardia sp. NBC_00565]WUC07008.1 serine protease [Nocardia sp. NBC_00565]
MVRIARIAAVLAAALIGAGAPAASPAAAIVGGSTVVASDYPWLAAIGSPVFLIRPSGQFCGGALIAPDRVVTAAHCVNLARLLPQALTVTFGRSDLRIRDGVTVGVKEIRIHPDFRDTDFDGETVHHNDLAILILDEPRPGPYLEVAAPQRDPRAYGDTGTILGWGATTESDTSNTLLRSATVPIVLDTTCAAAYGPAFDPAEMLCAGSPDADTAEYDSGDPLLAAGRLIGLTSWGEGSARPGFPGVYAHLTTVSF